MNNNDVFIDYPMLSRALNDFEETETGKDFLKKYYPDSDLVCTGIRTAQNEGEADIICVHALCSAELMGFVAGYAYAMNISKEIGNLQGINENGAAR